MKKKGLIIIICLIISNIIFYAITKNYLNSYFEEVGEEAGWFDYVTLGMWHYSAFALMIGYVLLVCKQELGRWFLIVIYILEGYFFLSMTGLGILSQAPLDYLGILGICTLLFAVMLAVLLMNHDLKQYVASGKKKNTDTTNMIVQQQDRDMEHMAYKILSEDSKQEDIDYVSEKMLLAIREDVHIRNGVDKTLDFLNLTKWNRKKVCYYIGAFLIILMLFLWDNSPFSLRADKRIIYHAIEQSETNFRVKRITHPTEYYIEYVLKAKKNTKMEDYVKVVQAFNEYVGDRKYLQNKKYCISFIGYRNKYFGWIESGYPEEKWKLDKLNPDNRTFQKLSQLEPFQVLELETLTIPGGCIVDDITVLEKFPELDSLIIFAELTEEQEAYVKEIFPNSWIRIGDRVVSE